MEPDLCPFSEKGGSKVGPSPQTSMQTSSSGSSSNYHMNISAQAANIPEPPRHRQEIIENTNTVKCSRCETKFPSRQSAKEDKCPSTPYSRGFGFECRTRQRPNGEVTYDQSDNQFWLCCDEKERMYKFCGKQEPHELVDL